MMIRTTIILVVFGLGVKYKDVAEANSSTLIFWFDAQQKRNKKRTKQEFVQSGASFLAPKDLALPGGVFVHNRWKDKG